MLKDLTADNIYIVCGHTDMRKSIDGLAALVQQQFQLDLFTSSAFLFCGRRRDRMKVLLWEDDGFLLLYKRLEDGKFSWPRNEQEVRKYTVMWTIFLCFNGTLFLERSDKLWYNQSIMNRLEFQGKECFCYDIRRTESSI